MIQLDPTKLTYDGWLALTGDERERMHRSWNPYGGEGRAIPAEAMKRLIARSPLPLARELPEDEPDGVGIYHGGEYILNPMLPPSLMSLAPPFLTTEFDGFRVGYCAQAADRAAELGRGAEGVAALAAELAAFGAEVYSLPTFAAVPIEISLSDAICGDLVAWSFLITGDLQVVWRESSSRDRWGIAPKCDASVGDDAWYLTLRDVLIALGLIEAPPGYEVP